MCSSGLDATGGKGTKGLCISLITGSSETSSKVSNDQDSFYIKNSSLPFHRNSEIKAEV